MTAWTAVKSGSSAEPKYSRKRFADKAYVTQISMHVNADTYAPDIHALVESGAWRVAEEGTWQKARKGNDQVEGFRFVTYERNHEE